MRNLLGTNLGYSGLFTLIQFMNTEGSTGSGVSNDNDNNSAETGGEGNSAARKCAFGSSTEMDSVVRGAVFFTGVVLWGGSNRVVRSLTRGASAGGGGGGIVGVVLGAYEKVTENKN